MRIQLRNIQMEEVHRIRYVQSFCFLSVCATFPACEHVHQPRSSITSLFKFQSFITWAWSIKLLAIGLSPVFPFWGPDGAESSSTLIMWLVFVATSLHPEGIYRHPTKNHLISIKSGIIRTLNRESGTKTKWLVDNF